MQITNISEAKTSLSHLIKLVQKTKEPIVIGKAGEPVAVLSAYNQENGSPRQLGGSWQGKVKVSAYFDEIDPDIAESFYNSRLIPSKS